MGGEANIWNPRTLIEVSGDTKSVEEKLTANANQTLFTLTDFVYVVATGALTVHKNGLLLTKGTDWNEQTESTFSIVSPCTAGDTIVATGDTAITGTVDVRDTDIFILNYQAVRDYAGTETTLYVQSKAALGDDGESFFQKRTGAAPGFYVDDDNSIIVPTGGDGSVGWLRKDAAATPFDQGAANSVIIPVEKVLRDHGSITRWGGNPGLSADQTVFLNNAISDLSTAGGGDIFVPPGVYFFDGAIVPKPNVTIWGLNRYSTTLSLRQSNIAVPNFSLIDQDANLENFHIKGIGLRGNRSFQTTPGINASQDLCGVSFQKGYSKRNSVRDCYIREFGDSTDTAGGGVVIIPEVGVADASIQDTHVDDNHFGPNNNVPGVYMWPYIGGILAVSFNNSADRNTFAGGGDQNCVYMAGNEAFPMRNCTADENRFYIVEDCDVMIEMNGVKGGSASRNIGVCTATGLCGGILVRGSSAAAAGVDTLLIDDNILVNLNAGHRDGISLVSFAGGDFQDNIKGSNNIIVDFGGDATHAAIKVLKGSRNVSLSANDIIGKLYRPNAYNIGECDNVTVDGGNLVNCNKIATLSAGTDPVTRNVTIINTEADGCGLTGNPLIGTTGGAIDMEDLLVKNNKSRNTVAGVTAYALISTVAPTGNRIYDNDVDTVKENGLPVNTEQGRQRISATTTTPVTNATATYADIGLSVTITPRFDNSEIRIEAAVDLFIEAGTAQDLKIRLLRDAVVIREDVRALGNGTDIHGTKSFVLYDTPATQSATVYKFQIAKDAGGGASVTAQNSNSPSDITVSEVEPA
jgi:hypothetical protein